MSAFTSRRTRRLLAIVSTSVALPILGITGVSVALAANHYPRPVTRQFVTSCVSAATTGPSHISKRRATTYCKAALACIERRLTFNQFKQTAIRLQTGQPNPGARVLRSCEQVALKKIKK